MITCSCNRVISSSLKYCPHCARPTSIEVYEKEKVDTDDLLKKKDEFLSLIPNIKNPEAQQQFIETLKYISEIAKNPELFREFTEFKEKITKGKRK